jgi:hypothetical protein
LSQLGIKRSGYPEVNIQEMNKQMFVRNSLEDMKADFPRGGNASEYTVKNGRRRHHQDDLLYDVSITMIDILVYN